MSNESFKDLKQYLENFKIKCTEDDCIRFKNNVALLEQKGLSELSKRLFSQTKRVHFLSALTEHNFTANLLKSKPLIQNEQIKYEPNDTCSNRPPDLHININGNNYWIQIKRFSELKYQNIQNRIYDEIDNKFSCMSAAKFIILRISNDFNANDIDALVKFVREKSSGNNNEEEYVFIGSKKGKAKFYFREPNHLKLHHLTLETIGDANKTDMNSSVNITGFAKDQIKSSLLNAAGAFIEESNKKNINVIVAESDEPSHDMFDLCESLYGTVFPKYDTASHKVRCYRHHDGLFNDDSFAKKIAGVIVIRKKNHAIIDDYWQVLCSNPHNEEFSTSIAELIPIDKITNKLSDIGNGFFDLDTE